MRNNMMKTFIENQTQYIRHYTKLETQYQSSKEIFEQFDDDLKEKIRKKAEQGGYKFQMYLKINLLLEKSPYLQENSAPITNDIVKFRLGSHCLPIEKGRWSRTPREERKCVMKLILYMIVV